MLKGAPDGLIERLFLAPQGLGLGALFLLLLLWHGGFQLIQDSLASKPASFLLSQHTAFFSLKPHWQSRPEVSCQNIKPPCTCCHNLLRLCCSVAFEGSPSELANPAQWSRQPQGFSAKKVQWGSFLHDARVRPLPTQKTAPARYILGVNRAPKPRTSLNAFPSLS